MKRTLLCGLLACALLSMPARAVRAVPVQVDGTLLEKRGTLSDGVTYVPLRTLLDTLGGWELSWDAQAKEAVALSSSARLTASPEKGAVTFNGAEYPGHGLRGRRPHLRSSAAGVQYFRGLRRVGPGGWAAPR